MRAKKLEILRFKNVSSIHQGISPILYNLAFSPRIKYVDISDIGTIRGYQECAEAIYKLIKISGSIEYLNMSNTGIFAMLTEDFFKALGENKTLRSLFIDTTMIEGNPS